MITKEKFQKIYNTSLNYINKNNVEEKIYWVKKYYNFYAWYKISKSLWSSMTKNDAIDMYHQVKLAWNQKKFDYVDNILEKVLNSFRDISNEEERNIILWKLYYQLEYKNIIKALEYIDLDENKNLKNEIEKFWLTDRHISELHILVSNGIDKIFGSLLPESSRFFPWYIRDHDSLVVDNIQVPPYEEVQNVLNYIREKSLNINSIFDIFEIHYQLYRVHPFHNGNKRTCRLVEELLLNFTWFNDKIPTTFWYYMLEGEYTDKLVETTFHSNNYDEWIITSMRSHLLALSEYLSNILKTKLYDEIKNLEIINKYEDYLFLRNNFSYTDLFYHIKNIVEENQLNNTNINELTYNYIYDLFAWDAIKIYNKNWENLNNIDLLSEDSIIQYNINWTNISEGIDLLEEVLSEAIGWDDKLIKKFSDLFFDLGMKDRMTNLN